MRRFPRKGFVILFSMVFLMAALSAGAEEVESPAAALQSLVKQEFERNHFKEVIQAYQDFQKKHATRFIPYPVRILYSQSLAETGSVGEAILILQATIDEIPLDIDMVALQYNLANLLFMEKRYEEAKSILKKILHQSSRFEEIFKKTRERLATMGEAEGKRKDLVSLQILDIETSLEAGEVPDGVEEILKTIREQNPARAEQVQDMLNRIREVRTAKARALLEEARRVFDEERKFPIVEEMLQRIEREYTDVCDRKSVDVLKQEVSRKLGRNQ